MAVHMRRLGRLEHGLLIGFTPVGPLLAAHPELLPYLDEGSIVHFQARPTQMGQVDFPWGRL